MWTLIRGSQRLNALALTANAATTAEHVSVLNLLLKNYSATIATPESTRALDAAVDYWLPAISRRASASNSEVVVVMEISVVF